jgi:glycerate 2-kinase
MPSIDALRADVRTIFDAALRAVNGERQVFEALQHESLPGPVALIAVGKAAVSMSRGAARALGEQIASALVITKHGYQGELPWPVVTAGHPVPDENSLAAGARLHRLIAELPPEQAVLVLLSGGASSLVEMLPPGVTLNDLRALNQWLLGSGLDIASVNRMRARASLLKGGRMAQLLAPRPVLCLAISDVPDDDPAWIGSGPLTAMPSPAAAAGAAPDFVRTMLDHGPPAPTASDPCFQHVYYHIVARREDAVSAAAAAASALGYDAVPEREILRGDALQQGARLARELLATPAGCVRIRGGETTVTLPSSPGRGGRNQSLVLAAAQVLDGVEDCVFLAAGTDGSDGPGTDAGALVDGATLARGRAAGMDAEDALQRADAGAFLAASGDLFATGPTGTNVMDLCIGLRL